MQGRPWHAHLFGTVVLIVLLAVGCTSRPVRLVQTDGYVVFHDTDLRLAAAISLNDMHFIADDGSFSVALRPGEHAYKLFTLIGTDEGTFKHDGTTTLRLQLPPFPQWNSTLFDSIAFSSVREFTTRWERGQKVKVWIQPFTGPSEGSALRALEDWQKVLKETITFVRVPNYNDADMTIRFVPPSELPGYQTIGTCTRWYDAESGFMIRAEIAIERSWASHTGLHRHEVGHCIGLGHSTDKQHLMYPVLYNDVLTPVEENLARLLYSVPPKTKQLSVRGATLQATDHHLLEHHIERNGPIVVETVR